MPSPKPQTRTTAQLKPQTLTTLGFSEAEAAVIVAIAAQVPAVAAAVAAQLDEISASAQVAAQVPAAETRAAIAAIVSGAIGMPVPAVATAVSAAAQIQAQLSAQVPGIATAVSASSQQLAIMQVAAQVPAIAASVVSAAIAQAQLNVRAPGAACTAAAAALVQAQLNAAVPAIGSAIAAAVQVQAQASGNVPAIAAAVQVQSGTATNAQISAAVPAIANAVAAAITIQAQMSAVVPGVVNEIAAAVPVAAQMSAAVPGVASNMAGAIASGYGPLTLDYQSRVNTAGGTISTAGLNLVEAFFYSSYSDGAAGTGRVSDFASLFPFLWMPATNFAGILVPLLGSNFTNTGFVSGDWNIQSGLQCATGKYLDSNWNSSGFTSSIAAGMGYWTPTIPSTANTRIAIGVASSGSNDGFDMGVSPGNLWRSRAYQVATSTNAVASEKFLYSFRSDANTVGHQRNLALTTSSVAASSALALPVFLGARNSAGAATTHWTAQISAGWVTNGILTVPQRTVLYNAMNAFATGRSSL